jgi:hypothetical protein
MPGALGGDHVIGPAARTGVGPGVTDDSVTVVFVGVDLAKTSSLTGFYTAPTGDGTRQVKALETWVNSNGGIAGRKLHAIFRPYEASDDSPAAEEKLCNQITQDDKAFAVVLTGQLQANARPCYAQRHTLVLDATLVADDAATFEQLAPYLWSPSFPSYDDFVAGFLTTIAGQGFFATASTVGVVAADTPTNRGAYAKLVAPRLAALTVTPTVAWIDTTDLGTLNSGLNQAVVDFQAKGIDHVFFLGGARIAPFFLTSAAAQDYTAKYAISSYDNPTFLVKNPATIPQAALVAMIGIGFDPAQDVPDSGYPFPATDSERECVDIFKAAGETFAARENARVALSYCDAARVLAAGAKNLGANLNAYAWSDAVGGLGGFQPASGFNGAWAPGRYAAANTYRVLGYDQPCGCFLYRGGDVAFGNG